MNCFQTVVKLAPVSLCILLSTQSLAANSDDLEKPNSSPDILETQPSLKVNSVDHSDIVNPELNRHAVYFDALGRGGLWGLGYDFMAWKHFGLGATVSYYQLDAEKYLTLSPYLSFYPLSLEKHRWLMQVGPQLIRKSTVSPVPEWNGISSTHFSGAFATGYEFRSRFLFRVYGMVIVGDSGVLPWTGASVGWTF